MDLSLQSTGSFACPFCQTERQLILDVINQEYICSVCKMIHSEKITWVGPSFDSSSTFTDAELASSTTAGSNNSNMNKTDFSGKKVKASVYNELKSGIQKSKNSTSINRTKHKALTEIQRLTKILNLDESITRECIQEYNKFNEAGHFRNRNIYSCVCSIVSIISARNDCPISIGQILKHSIITKGKFNTDYFYITRLYSKAPVTTASTKKFLERYISYLEPSWSEYDQFIKTIEECAENINLFNKIGREGIVTTGTLVYYILKYYKYPKKDVLVKAIITNRLTLKNCWADLLTKYPSLKQYDTSTTTSSLKI